MHSLLAVQICAGCLVHLSHDACCRILHNHFTEISGVIDEQVHCLALKEAPVDGSCVNLSKC